MMIKITRLLIATICACVAWQISNAQQSDKPNILIVIGDDCTYNDLPLYGGKNVKTPNIDKLASEGLTFNKAYVSMSMCTPSRTELYTGLYPATSGACWNHAKARTGTKSIVQHLGKHGYRTGIAGKLHIKPKTVFPFELVPGVERNCVKNTAGFNPDGMMEFVSRDKEQPFCLVTALTSPHAPWTVGDPSHFNPDSLVLPPYMVDTKETREEYAKYLAEVEVLDEQTGKTIQVLKDAGVYDNTIVIFTSEQGSQFPYCKWTNYENGVHTGFVVKWQGVAQPGTRTNALIQYSDVLPTLLDAIGGDVKGFDGTSFLSVLKGESDTHRQYAYSMHNNFPEGPSYPIRSVTDGTYHYILNLNHENMYIEKHLMGKPDHTTYWPSWMLNITRSDRNFDIVSGYMLRPKEELFEPGKDKYERNNLAGKREYSEIQKQLAQELENWMNEQGDPGAPLDKREEFNAQRRGEHFEVNVSK
ncbi:sulfatase family protein [Thermophagus sp. OGC60D27]|uniref:sulfatase family protein n=1 Tax=Thermophagus sp. OGC60D27 TaxID=3458415 RepID=UPI0040379F21